MAPAVLKLYLENLPLVKVQHFLLEAIVAHRLHARQTHNLDQWVLLSDTIFYVCVQLESHMMFIVTISAGITQYLFFINLNKCNKAAPMLRVEQYMKPLMKELCLKCADFFC